MKPQKGLGRGLEAIFSSEKIEAAPIASTTDISIDHISPNPTQPRREIDDEQLAELSQSIAELGIIQPITVRRTGVDKYMIISGERRWRASQQAGLEKIPAYVREVDDEQMHTMALVENLQREDLNPIEISLGLQRLIDECGLTQESLAQRVSMKRSSISNYLRLLKLSDEVQFALRGGAITMGHAKALASVIDREAQLKLLAICIERGISVREAEAIAARLADESTQAESKTEVKRVASVPKGYESLSQKLEGIFPKGVEFKANKRGGGKIVINYSSNSELQQLIREFEANE